MRDDSETGSACGQDVEMYQMDEECGQLVSVRVKYGANPSFTLLNLKNNQVISGIRLFTSELQKVMTFL